MGGLIIYPLVTIFNWLSMILTIKAAEKHAKLHRTPQITSMSDLGHKVFGIKGKIIVDLSVSVL